jgi:LacI family transcriptional regulator
MQSNVVERVIKQSLPTVFVDYPSADFTSVGSDDWGGGRMAAEHLLGRGYRNFVYLMEEGEDTGFELAGHRRRDAFLKTVADAGCASGDVTITRAQHGIEGARAKMTDLLACEPRPRAVFCHDDTLAVGALLAATALGLNVPEDLAVMGFDDDPIAAAARLTTVRQPFEQSGRVAARALVQHMEDPAHPAQSIQLGLELVQRAST